MEIRDLAEQILFGATLEDKLAAPGELTDRLAGSPIPVPAAPARPAGLAFRAGGGSAFPGLGSLDAPGARGRLLHAFANHELLAVELMALILLRFPEAPAPFRAGLAHTLAEEQTHLSLYVARMAELGVTFGESPLSAYFWEALSRVRSPLEFVAAMSLTFEQANLDHALAYSHAFAAAGDAATAALLQRVHDDEIGHVRHGLTWLERWREPDEATWEAYRRALPAPLTPCRAKGLEFSWESRRRVGFDDRFCRELFVFSSSKGRQPIVFFFNPACEEEIARGRAGHQPTQAVRALQRDYAPLLGFLAQADDAVLVPRRPSLDYLVALRELGVEWPEWVETGDDPRAGVATLARRGVSGVRPWGWSPETLLTLEPFAESSAWSVPSDRLARLYAKDYGAELLRAFEPEAGAGAFAETVEAALVRVRATGGWSVLKARWGTSGRAMIRVAPDEPLTASQRGWLERTLADQGGVVVEPWFERVCDLSVQLELGPDGLRGSPRVTRLLTDRRGQYRGHVIGQSLAGLPQDVLRAIHGDGGQKPSLIARLEEAGRFVAGRLAAQGFVGACGVDAFLYRDGDALRLRPIVEVNPRTTMGTIALALQARLRPRVALWLHMSVVELARAGFGQPRAFARAVALVAPPCVEGGRLESGVLFTNDPSQAEGRVSFLCSGQTYDSCVAVLDRVLGPSPPLWLNELRKSS